MQNQNASGFSAALPRILLMAAVWGVVVTICNVPKVGNAQQATANETPSAQQHSEPGEEQFPPIKYAVNSGKPCLIYDTIGSLRLLPRTDMQRVSCPESSSSGMGGF